MGASGQKPEAGSWKLEAGSCQRVAAARSSRGGLCLDPRHAVRLAEALEARAVEGEGVGVARGGGGVGAGVVQAADVVHDRAAGWQRYRDGAAGVGGQGLEALHARVAADRAVLEYRQAVAAGDVPQAAVLERRVLQRHPDRDAARVVLGHAPVGLVLVPGRGRAVARRLEDGVLAAQLDLGVDQRSRIGTGEQLERDGAAVRAIERVEQLGSDR